jgi:hypothetical protein
VGLASQKLRQKHHLAHQEEQGPRTSAAATAGAAQEGRHRPIRDKNSDHQVAANNLSESQIGSTIASQVLLPVVSVFYMIEHRKQLFIRARVHELRAFLSWMVTYIFKSLPQGPISTMKAVLEIGGGKKNMTLTFTVACTVFLLLRPMLQAVVTESPVGP